MFVDGPHHACQRTRGHIGGATRSARAVPRGTRALTAKHGGCWVPKSSRLSHCPAGRFVAQQHVPPTPLRLMLRRRLPRSTHHWIALRPSSRIGSLPCPSLCFQRQSQHGHARARPPASRRARLQVAASLRSPKNYKTDQSRGRAAAAAAHIPAPASTDGSAPARPRPNTRSPTDDSLLTKSKMTPAIREGSSARSRSGRCYPGSIVGKPRSRRQGHVRDLDRSRRR